MKEIPVNKKTEYRIGQTWYMKERVDEKRYTYVPLKIIAIYPHIILTETRNGLKQAFTKACAFLELFTAAEAAIQRKMDQ